VQQSVEKAVPNCRFCPLASFAVPLVRKSKSALAYAMLAR